MCNKREVLVVIPTANTNFKVIPNLAPILHVRGVFNAALVLIQLLDSFRRIRNEERSKSSIGRRCYGRPSRMFAIQCEFATEEERGNPGHNR